MRPTLFRIVCGLLIIPPASPFSSVVAAVAGSAGPVCSLLEALAALIDAAEGKGNCSSSGKGAEAFVAKPGVAKPGFETPSDVCEFPTSPLATTEPAGATVIDLVLATTAADFSPGFDRVDEEPENITGAGAGAAIGFIEDGEGPAPELVSFCLLEVGGGGADWGIDAAAWTAGDARIAPGCD